MKETLTKTMSWLHTWAGLLLGWVLFAIFITGTLSVFDQEITRWMQPENRSAQLEVSADTMNAVEAEVGRLSAGVEQYYLIMPTPRSPSLTAWWVNDKGEFLAKLFDSGTGLLVRARETMGGHFFVHFHFSFNLWPAGAYVVAAFGVGMLLLLVSGIIVHKRIFKDFFVFRPKANAQRAWLDAHNVTSVLALPFHIMITYTGIAVFHATYVPAGVAVLYGGDSAAFEKVVYPSFTRPAAKEHVSVKPLGEMVRLAEPHWGRNQVASVAVTNPGDRHMAVTLTRRADRQIGQSPEQITFDGATGSLLHKSAPPGPALRTHQVMTGLHFAQLGGYGVRWIYFLLGLSGAAMIGSGLILFVVKRQGRVGSDQQGLWAAERLNAAAILGPLVASAVFLWANRLLPAELSGRDTMEIIAFLAALAGCVVHALWRGPNQAWSEQLALAALLCLGLPVLNAITSDLGLARTLASGNVPVAGVDIVAVLIGFGLAVLLVRLRRRGAVAIVATQPG